MKFKKKSIVNFSTHRLTYKKEKKVDEKKKNNNEVSPTDNSLKCGEGFNPKTTTIFVFFFSLLITTV